MGYSSSGSLVDLFDDSLPERVARITAERVGTALREEIEERTPEAAIPAAYKGNIGRWVADRKGRRPGTLKGSWKESAVRMRPGPQASVSVYTDDPAAPHVEWDTRPHVIRPRKPGGSLRFPLGLDFVFRKMVRHPGTTGVHMARDGLAAIEVGWVPIAEEVLAELVAEEEVSPV